MVDDPLPTWPRVRRVVTVTTASLFVAAALATIGAFVLQARGNTVQPVKSDTSNVIGVAGRSCGTVGRDTVGGGYGPARESFTLKAPPGFITFNSIIDSKSYGDERAFFDVRYKENTEAGSYCNGLKVKDGDLLVLRTFLENGAPDSTAGEVLQGPGVATGTRLRLLADDDVSSLRRIQASISADNAQPPIIWDTIELAADNPFRLDFVRGSGTAISNAQTASFRLPDEVWGERGALIGSRALDGRVPPGYAYLIVLHATVRVTFVNN